MIQKRDTEKRRKLDALVFVNSLVSEIVMFSERVNGSIQGMKELEHLSLTDAVPILHLKIDTPLRLRESIDRFSILDAEVAVPLAQAVGIGTTFDQAIDLVMGELMTGRIALASSVKIVKNLNTHLKHIRASLDEVNAVLKKIN